MRLNKELTLFTLGTLVVLSFFAVLTSGQPNGATISPGTQERAPADPADTHAAWAGNITELTITSFSTTQTWAGYYGNVSGLIELTDNLNNTLYNWSTTDPGGEIYASINSSITWNDIQCFNITATGNGTDETGNGGTTSLYGKNMSQLEAEFNIGDTDTDGVNETFADGDSHDAFTTSSQQFDVGECLEVILFDQVGASVNNSFEETILWEGTSGAVVFASILDDDVLGFDNVTHDFQMIVLEDGHGADVATTSYFFYVELS